MQYLSNFKAKVKKLLTSRIFLGCLSCAIVLGGLVAGGLYFRTDSSAETAAPVKTTTSTTTTSSTTTTTTLPPKTPQPAAANLPLLNGATIGSGANSANVALYEQRLVDLKFDPGTVDNVFDGKTQFAVQSLQKYKGLPITGRLSDADITALNTFLYEEPFNYPSEANRVEINLDKQILIVYQNNFVRLITTTSTGNQKEYCYTALRTQRRTCSKAVTPTGDYKFFRRYKGWEPGDLGKLYNPVYFNGGIAVHGYNSVPTTPASHGCARIPMYISEYFPSLVENGWAVHVTAAVPVANYANRVGDVVVPKTTATTVPATTPATEVTTTTQEPFVTSTTAPSSTPPTT